MCGLGNSGDQWGQNYFYNNTEMSFYRFILISSRIYNGVFQRLLWCVMSQQTECRSRVRMSSISKILKKFAKMVKECHFSVNSLSGGNFFGKIYNLYKHIVGLLFLNESLQLFSISNMVNIDRYNPHKSPFRFSIIVKSVKGSQKQKVCDPPSQMLSKGLAPVVHDPASVACVPGVLPGTALFRSPSPGTCITYLTNLSLPRMMSP